MTVKSSIRDLCRMFAVLLAACGTPLQHGLEERDANEILSVLTDRGFGAQKVPEKGKKPTWAIEVSSTEASEAMRVLTQLKLPRAPRVTTKSIIQNPGLIETASAERLRQLEAQEGDIEDALETMDGVAGASVELVVPLAVRPGQPLAPSKASVLLRAHAGAMERLHEQGAELRALVAGAVDGLKAEDVVLVIDPVSLVAAAPHESAPASSVRPLAIGLATALTLVGVLLVVVAARLRHARGASKAPVPPPHKPERPVVSPGVQRKVKVA